MPRKESDFITEKALNSRIFILKKQPACTLPHDWPPATQVHETAWYGGRREPVFYPRILTIAQEVDAPVFPPFVST